MVTCNQTKEEPKPDESNFQKSGLVTLTDEQSQDRLKQATFMLAEMVKNPSILQEVMEGVNSLTYEDENILMADLLEPQTSTIFSNKASSMQFPSRFNTVFSQKMYPNASQFLSVSSTQLKYFLAYDKVSIYVPYSENWRNNQLPTLVWNTVEELDATIGYRPNLNSSGQITGYTQVTVNDDYAERNLVWILKRNSKGGKDLDGGIIKGGTVKPPIGSTKGIPCSQVQDPNRLYQIFVGEVRVVEQLDPFFGTNNSGGAEIVFARGSAYLPAVNASPLTGFATIALPKIKRKDIRKKNWITFYYSYYRNWKPEETQHILGCYEQDKTEPKYLEGTASIKIDTINLEFKMKFDFSSNNQVQYNQDEPRCAYFETFDIPSPGPRGGLRNGWRIYVGQYTDFTLPFQK